VLQCRSTAREVRREPREGSESKEGQDPTKKEAQRNGDAHNNKQQKAHCRAKQKREQRAKANERRERAPNNNNDGLQAERKAQQHDPAARKRAENQRWPKTARKLASRVEAKIRRTSEPK